jgi:SAM-dependent methyltransferase
MTQTTTSSGNEEAVEEQPVKVSLACGQRKPEGYIGVDIADIEGVDVVHDLNVYPWPFEDESVDELETSHYIEHIPHESDTPGKDGLSCFMDECFRILKPGGKLLVVAPYYNSIRAWQDPTHRRAISEATFLYYNKEWRATNGLDHYKIDSDYDFVYGYAFDQLWASRSEESRNFAAKHYTNVISDIFVTLTKRA